jgi:peroxiredoxin
MKTACCILISALTVGQPTSRSEWQLAPQFVRGLELVYAGSYTEESLVPNVHFHREYRLESLLFVLEPTGRHWDVAFMTALSPMTAPSQGKDTKPSSVRLEIGRVDLQGKLVGPQAPHLLIPIAGPPLLETGCLVEGPAMRLNKDSMWEVSEGERPSRLWQVLGLEAVNGVTCIKIIGEQQSVDWDRPRADNTAWRRREMVWIHPQLGVAQRVERVIERRDPARRDPTYRSKVQYDLESQLRYPGRLYDDRKQEILNAKRLHEDAVVLLRQPAQHRPQLESLLKKVTLHLDNQAPTPYRKAVFHLASRLDSARRGETPPELVPQEYVEPVVAAVGLGQRVPDFVVSEVTGKTSTRLARLLGRPVLVVFYNPATEPGRDAMLFARSLVHKHGDRIAVLAMAANSDPDTALKQKQDLELPFPVHDGRGMRLTFGVEATPRLVLLDGDGIIRSAHTGWGAHVPGEIQDELRRWLPK